MSVDICKLLRAFRFGNSAFCPHSVFMFRVILAKNRAYVLENIVDRLVFVVKTLSLCSVKAAADCTTSRKVAGSISDGVIGIFH